MGSYTSNIKVGKPFSQIKNTLRPLDLLFFNGGDFYADLIEYAQIYHLGDTREELAYLTKKTGVVPGAFSHVGMVVTSDILDHPLVLPGKRYLWESTMSGSASFNVNDIEGKSYIGVQLRDLDAVVTAYDVPNTTAIAVGYLLDNPSLRSKPEDKANFKILFTSIFSRYQGRCYEINPIGLLATVINWIRRYRKPIEQFCHTEGFMFCSELIASVYKDLGIIPDYIDPKYVVPMDFVGYTDTCPLDYIPPIIDLPPVYMVTDCHLSK